jgi:uncharacterized protein (UPF0261 family)
MGPVFVIGTCDTKGDELRFACSCVERAGAKAVLVDVSTGPEPGQADVMADVVASHHPSGKAAVLGLTDRGAAVAAMGVALTEYLKLQQNIGAVLGLGGSGNTSIVTQAMRALPVGVPKLMVSTLASGDVAGFVGPTDIAMMHAVADVAGLNAITRKVIGNAAHAAAGMALNDLSVDEPARPAVGLTMFGVTTAAITAIRSQLEPGDECFVFHATGTGGQSFEKLAESKYFSAVVDLTTTEVADYLCGGILACTADRFGAFIRLPLPYVGSVGACDMVNFGALDTVPERYAHRLLHVHNPHVTLMRTTVDENRLIGQFIVERLNQMTGPVRFLLPLRGISAIDAPGQVFHDPVADSALFETIRRNWRPATNRQLVEIDAHINDPTFAAQVVHHFRDIRNG